MKNLLTQFWNNEDGVTAIEYALIGVAMAVTVGVAVNGTDGTSGLKGALKSAFDNITSSVSAGSNAAK